MFDLLGTLCHLLGILFDLLGTLLVLKNFGEYWFAFGVIGALNTHENEIFGQLMAPKYSREYCLWLRNLCTGFMLKWIFWQVLLPKYFGEYCFAFTMICALNTHENGIFRQQLVPKYFGEYCFAFGVICALNTHENGVFWQQGLPKYCGEYWFALEYYVHSLQLKMTSFSSS